MFSLKKVLGDSKIKSNDGNFEPQKRWTFAPAFSDSDDAKTFETAKIVALISNGRERVERVKIFRGNETIDAVKKTFPRANFLQRHFSDKNIGTKAQRAFRAAQILRERGVGTPEPLALCETLDAGGNVLESRIFTRFEPGLTNFRDEVFRLFSEEPDCAALMGLFEAVAKACRAFHDCGILHRDLGNQNIGLRKDESGAWQVLFLDLDRVRIFDPGSVTDAQRGRDMARIDLPSDLLRAFYVLYFERYSPTGAFYEAEARERRAFERHSRWRPWRHPLREWKIRREERRAAARATAAGTAKAIPLGKDLWIWDSRSEQAIPAYMSRERRGFRSAGNIFKILKAFLRHGNAFWRAYKKLPPFPCGEPIDHFERTLGISLEADPATWQSQLHWLGELEGGNAKVSVLIRAYHHKGRAHWDFVVAAARELSARGNAVALALVQDRAAVLHPESWREMLMTVIAGTKDFADFYEVGHASNRGKWGIWDFEDYTQKLLPAAIEAKRAFPQIRLTGPACIDFDLHTLAGILADVPAGTFDALSQHLYVDRRGAPENFQGRFDLVGKAALHSLFAKIFAFPSQKIIVSEYNWPLLGAGVYGPVDSPVETFGPWETRPAAPWADEPPRVSETDAAQFSLRYWLLAMASGYVERVYFWRLLHRGFGLVDDADPQNPRPREGFFAFKKLLSLLAGTRFERRIFDVPAGTWALEFSRGNGGRFYLTWTKDSFPQVVEHLSDLKK
ncbi:MAG: lipopolysaccharide kinase InaA family protein [Opitutales bacterium]|nr:lipopolysaccharide kinase InaA family protein [Opitutales bacterium]